MFSFATCLDELLHSPGSLNGKLRYPHHTRAWSNPDTEKFPHEHDGRRPISFLSLFVPGFETPFAFT